MLDASDEGENFMERLSMRIPENAAVILKGLSEAGYEAYVGRRLRKGQSAWS